MKKRYFKFSESSTKTLFAYSLPEMHFLGSAGAFGPAGAYGVYYSSSGTEKFNNLQEAKQALILYLKNKNYFEAPQHLANLL